LVCLANSRKYLGSCVAGKRWGKGVEAKWVRPVSNRIGGEIPSDGTIYQNGEQVKVLDLVKLSIDEAVPSGYQQENILVTKYGWEKVGRAEWEMLQSLVDDDRSPLWPDSGNRTDRIPVDQALKLDSSLRLIYVENLKISVAMNGYKQQLRAKFQHHKISYNLAITDRAVETKYLSRPHDEHLLSTAYLCISIAEPFKGYCYKIVASVIEPSTQIN
jgi:hypothetical protein